MLKSDKTKLVSDMATKIYISKIENIKNDYEEILLTEIISESILTAFEIVEMVESAIYEKKKN